jgi:hypothetical protein
VYQPTDITVANHNMTVPQEGEIHRLSKIISTLQASHASLVEGLQRDLADAYKLLAEVNLENEELAQTISSLSHENSELMARLEAETAQNGALRMQIKFLIEDRHAFGLQGITTNQIKISELSHLLGQQHVKNTSIATEKMDYNGGSLKKKRTQDLNSVENYAAIEPPLNQSDKKRAGVFGYKIAHVLDEPMQRRKSLPLLPGCSPMNQYSTRL